jgi:hypothetical protein
MITVRTEPWGRKARPITKVVSTLLGKEDMAIACRPFGTNRFKEGAMWHVDQLLGNDLEKATIHQLLLGSGSTN